MGKPFIKKFEHGGFNYIYDVNTNQIVEVEEEVFAIIDSYTDDKLDGFEEISFARSEHGLFSTFRPEKVQLGPSTAMDVKKFHSQNTEQLLLELTSGCNLNCSYCPVAGKYTTSDNSNFEMSPDLCRRSLEFFLENSQNSIDPFISFYGGEPLTRFQLIRDTIEYVRSGDDGLRYGFGLTTNGTLLNQEIIEFFVDHNVILNISLDGPEYINDRYRTTLGGSGSFHTIIKNLEFLNENYSDYYSKNVSIACVLAPPFDFIDETLSFFQKESIFNKLRKNGKIKSSTLDTRDSSFIDKFDLQESIDQFFEISELFSRRFEKAILAGDLSSLTLERRPIENILYNLATRAIRKLYPYNHPFGACHIGLKRLFVKTNGDFHICERSGDDYKIGHIDTGFDYEQIAYYYRKLEEVLADCRDCWALSHCERCWIRLGNLEEFEGEKKENFCRSQKRFIEKAFKLYVSLLKEDPDCLKILRKSV